MPSLGDVANQILDVLNHIQTNTATTNATLNQIKGDTAGIRADTTAIRTELVAGFAMLGQGLFAILEQQKATNSLLLEETHQNRTIICWLTNIADVLCRMMRLTIKEVELQSEIDKLLGHLAAIADLVHAREAIEVLRLGAVEHKVDKCCPPAIPPPEPCFEPCRTEEVSVYQPKGGDWQPSAPPRQPG